MRDQRQRRSVRANGNLSRFPLDRVPLCQRMAGNAEMLSCLICSLLNILDWPFPGYLIFFTFICFVKYFSIKFNGSILINSTFILFFGF